ncbi:hypothetical protein FPOAC1_003865 [Fusarium poae]|uniref:hypothetical protein n=1 Tax=Fusarium poae TaxID=36050 RepID=UPI001CE984D5|nr:hypothetical protein FPOAC1_003865 [Fusarium poae]KAG8677837.1 hypothetical protein FPOAC1_003865 [Fusarium poae]
MRIASISRCFDDARPPIIIFDYDGAAVCVPNSDGEILRPNFNDIPTVYNDDLVAAFPEAKGDTGGFLFKTNLDFDGEDMLFCRGVAGLRGFERWVDELTNKKKIRDGEGTREYDATDAHIEVNFIKLPPLHEITDCVFHLAQPHSNAVDIGNMITPFEAHSGDVAGQVLAKVKFHTANDTNCIDDRKPVWTGNTGTYHVAGASTSPDRARNSEPMSNKRQHDADVASEEQRRLVKRARSDVTSEAEAFTLLSVDDIVFETGTNVGDISHGSFAAFFEPDPRLNTDDAGQLPIAGHAPVRFHYSWKTFDECMRERLGLGGTDNSTYCCTFICVPSTAQPLLRYEYHFTGQVGFGTLVQLLEARLVGCQLPIVRGVLDEVSASVRFTSSRMTLSGDYLLRADATHERNHDEDHMDLTG